MNNKTKNFRTLLLVLGFCFILQMMVCVSANAAYVQAWKSVGEGLPTTNLRETIRFLMAGPIDSGTMYLGTNYNFWIKQADKPWYALKNLPEGDKASLAIDPTKPTNMFLAAKESSTVGKLPEDVRDVIYQTTDRGQNWKIIFSAEDARADRIKTIVINPKNTRELFVGIEHRIDPNDSASLRYGRLFTSKDSGTTWTEINVKWVEFKRLHSIEQIVINPVNPQVIYLRGSDYWLDTSIYKSTDGGSTWKILPSVSPWPTGGNIPTALTIDPSNPDIVYLAMLNINVLDVYKSTDGGETWTEADKGLRQKGVSIPCLLVNPIAPQILYAIVNTSMERWQAHGIYVSYNGGSNWTDISGDLSGTNIFAHTLLWNQDKLYASVWGPKVFATSFEAHTS